MSDILSTLTGLTISDPRSVIDQGYIGDDTATASCLLKTFEVHSICAGVVIAVEQEPKTNHWCITVEASPRQWVRYRSLANCHVKTGQKVAIDDFLGYGYKGMMRLEYCTDQTSQFPVRISERVMYKHDPAPVIFGRESLGEVS